MARLTYGQPFLMRTVPFTEYLPALNATLMNINIPQARKKRLNAEQRLRSSYTASSAQNWLPVLKQLEEALKSHEEFFITSESAGRTPNTLCILLNDSLLWFIEQGADIEKAWATEFRARVKFRKEPGGVRVFRREITKPAAVNIITEADTGSVRDLKREVLNWYSEASAGDILEKTNTVIDNDLEEFLLKIASQLPSGELELNKQQNRFRIMK